MEFFADRELADLSQGVRLVLGQPVKSIQPVLQGQMPWENQGVDMTFSLLYDPQYQAYRLWYRSYMSADQEVGDQSRIVSSERVKRNHRTFICCAQSSDGIHWERPELGLFEFQGNRSNNIIAQVTADSVWSNVVYDPLDSDPARRYKALGYQVSQTSLLAGGCQTGIAVAFSPDGLHWTQPATVMDGGDDVTDADTLLPFREPTTGRWVGFFRPRTKPKRRFLGYAQSEDFLHWTYPRMLLTPTAGDTPWTEFYSMATALVAQRRFGLLWVYHNHPQHSVMTNELVYSRHGHDYQRVMPGREFLPLGSDGESDSRRAWPTAMLERGDEILIFYNAGNVEHGSDRIDAVTAGDLQPGRVAPGEQPVREIRMARLPWGHFAGLRADQEGMVETRWLTNYGRQGARIAAEIRPGGYIKAQVLDMYGAPLPGWDAQRSQVVVGGPCGRMNLSWGEGLDASFGQTSAAGGTVGHVLKLQFQLYRATLYGVSVGEEDARPALMA